MKNVNIIYFDEYNKFHCTENNRCPKNYKLIKDKNKCIDNCENDDIYKYEYCDKCFMFQPNDTFPGKNNCIYLEDDIIETSENLTIKNNKTFEEERDDYILRFRNYVLHFNVTRDKENIIESKNGVIYQITTLDNQKINSYKNISILELGDCGNQLISRNITDPNLPLIIFKIDFFPPGTSIPIVGYEIYHPLNKNKLDLTGCKIKLKIPVRIDENKLFKYEPNSKYYNDRCFSYTTENGTDIILADRKIEFIKNNLSLCPNNCNYTGYDKENKHSLCDCNVNNNLISELFANQNKVPNIFINEVILISFFLNIIYLKCIKTLFTKEGLKNNISSYIFIIFIMQFLLSIFLFIFSGYHSLNNIIQNILKQKAKIKKKNSIGNLKTTKKFRKK